MPQTAPERPQPTGTDSPKRRAILAAVERLMLAGARFAELSVAGIAAEAGTSRSTFYLHFEDKLAIVRYLIEALETELLDATNLVEDFVGGVTPDMLRMAMIRLIRVYRARVAYFSAIAEVAANDASISAQYQAMIEDTVLIREDLLRQKQREGLVRSDLPEQTYRCLAWMVERAVSQYVTPATREPVTEDAAAMALADALAAIIWRTLYENPDPSASIE